jgi:hypothetical protein
MTPDLFDVQVAMFERLMSEPNITQRVTGVYDYVPEGTNYPYVVLDSFSGDRNPTTLDQSSRFSLEQVIQVYTSDAIGPKGWQSLRVLVSCVCSLFDGLRLDVGGRYCQTIVSRFNLIRAEQLTRVGIVTVEVILF